MFSSLILLVSALDLTRNVASARKVNSKRFLESFEAHTYRAVIHRKVLPPSEGFHLEILSEVILSSPLISSSSSLNCTLRLTETLPSGLYVDAFQLRNFHQFGGPTVVFQRPVDTEAPAFESDDELLRVFHPFRLERDQQRLVSQVVLPVHLRYHRAVKKGEPTHVRFPIPRADISCWDDSSSVAKDSNIWVPMDLETANPSLKISVPRGDSECASYAIGATFLACLWAMAQLWVAKPCD